MLTILDNGPSQPVAPDADADAETVAAYTAATKDYDHWHKKHDAPVKKQMPAVDAKHAVAADPERYEIVPDEKPLTIEGRIARLEAEVFGPVDPTPVATKPATVKAKNESA